MIAGFLYELGVTLEWEEVQLLARLGGWVPRTDRRPGKITLVGGLRRLMDTIATCTFLDLYVAEYGHLTPRIAAMLGHAPPPELRQDVRLHHLLEKPTYSIIELGLHGGNTSRCIWFEQPILPLRRPNSYLPMCYSSTCVGTARRDRAAVHSVERPRRGLGSDEAEGDSLRRLWNH